MSHETVRKVHLNRRRRRQRDSLCTDVPSSLRKKSGGGDVCTQASNENGQLVDWGPFLESPSNFTGPKSNIQIEI